MHLRKFMRQTRQKELILKIVNESYNHLNAYEVYEKCLLEIPNISLGTVYRNLNNLSNMSLIRRIKMPDDIDRFDKYDFHAHFICIECKKVIDLIFPNNYIKKEIEGNLVLTSDLSFQGICKECLNKGGYENGTKRK